jgi:hypothetical protein
MPEPFFGWVEFIIPCTIVFTAVSNLFRKSYCPKEGWLQYVLALEMAVQRI